MQINLKFDGSDIVLSLPHQYPVQSLIYDILSEDKKLSKFIHDKGVSLGNKSFKMFTFGNLQGKYEIKDKTISYPEGFTLQIRSPMNEFIEAMIQAVSKRRTYTLCGCSLTLTEYGVKNATITENEIKIKTLSPIVVHTTIDDKKTRYFSPDDLEFYQAVAVNAINKFSAFRKELPSCNFYILPDCKFTEKNKTVTTYKNIYITGWNGYFTLKSSPQMLDFLYNTGLGTKNSQGFGMFEVIK